MSSILQKVAPIGEARDREMLKDASSHNYRTTPQGELTAYVFSPPEGVDTPRSRPVIIFFHGGFWESPMVTQFVPHCLHFASRGAVAIAAETRTSSKHGTGPVEAMEDAREVVRWVRRNASLLSIDPDRLTIGGAAGGAWQALLCTLPKDKEMPSEDGVSCRPQALALFSSLLNTTPKSGLAAKFPDVRTAKRLSPTALVRRKLPPMILFHGKNDRITPVDEARKFARRLHWRGNKCELVDYERAEHSFFNFNVSSMHFELTIGAMDRFLTERGLLQPAAESPVE
ncbi:alpha/beta hydrolase [Luteolibacter sp. LG18]|uniref:alpha/beta hydrolase n=1 Tax=Luteolibacter sp. LG18 TaxID=2819286 RepID=UPI0030C67229